MEKKHIVYKHTAPNGKVYIGQTSKTLKARSMGQGQGYKNNILFWRAIQKYGWDNFTHEILHSGLSQDEANELEIQLIAEYKSNDPEFGYNIVEGGKCGYKHPQWSKEKMSAERKGVKRSQDICDKQSVSMKEGYDSGRITIWNKGKKLSEEHKQHLSESHMGQTPPNKGKKENPEVTKLRAEKLRQYYKEHPKPKKVKLPKEITKQIAWNKGLKGVCHCSEENKKLNSIKFSNSVWVNNGSVNKRIPKEQLDEYISNGWCNKRINYKRTREGEHKLNNPKLSKRVKQYDKQGNFIKEWESLIEIERQLGYRRECVSKVCHGKRKTYKKFIWVFVS